MKRILNYLIFSAVILSVFAGCRKDAFEGTPSDNKGQTFVRFINKSEDAPVNALYFTPFTDIKKVLIADLRRDAGTSSSLNTNMKVTITIDEDAIDAYNDENDTEFELLPESIYTVEAPGYTKTSTGYTVTFNKGEFARPFFINLDGSQFDLDKKYVLPFKITTVEGAGKITNVTSEKTIFTTLGIKNKYDGIYEITEGTFTDALNPGWGHINTIMPDFEYTFADFGIDEELADDDGIVRHQLYEVRTISPNKCAVYDMLWFGDMITTFSTGTDVSGYGGFGLILEFDLATNEVISVTNYYGQEYGANRRSAELDPSGENQWTAGTMKLKYFMTENPNNTGATVRAQVSETWKFRKDR